MLLYSLLYYQELCTCLKSGEEREIAMDDRNVDHIKMGDLRDHVV